MGFTKKLKYFQKRTVKLIVQIMTFQSLQIYDISWELLYYSAFLGSFHYIK